MEMHKDYMFANAWENFKVPYGMFCNKLHTMYKWVLTNASI